MRAWISALRLRTLPLAAAAIIAGSAYARSQGRFDSEIFLIALLTAFLLQILSNLANDYGDHSHGVDDESRVGPQRAVQSGEITPGAMLFAVVFSALLAFISGCYLLFLSFYPEHLTELWVFLGLGSLSILGAYGYTAGKNPYGYRALGDLAVFLFFGVLGVGGSNWLFVHSLSLPSILGSFGFGFLIVSVLNLNNLRDLEADKTSGKKTLAVSLGEKNAKLYQYSLILAGISLISISYLVSYSVSLFSGALLVSMLFIPILFGISRKQGADLDPYLKMIALIILLLSILPWIGTLL